MLKSHSPVCHTWLIVERLATSGQKVAASSDVAASYFEKTMQGKRGGQGLRAADDNGLSDPCAMTAECHYMIN